MSSQFTGKGHHSQTNARHIYSRGSLGTRRASSSGPTARWSPRPTSDGTAAPAQWPSGGRQWISLSDS
jgi:hypothetical protein